MAPMPGDLKVEQTQGDRAKDNKPIHGDLKAERTGGGPKKDDEAIPSDFEIVGICSRVSDVDAMETHDHR